MADETDDDSERPVIIIKRVDDDHDDHHGGVWKIAFADFMTAMMAFFLVMWLINAANEETKAQVASYFNPVKLTDAVLAPKGVKSMDATSPLKEQPEDAEAQGSGPSDDKNTKASKSGTTAADTEGKTDDALFKDPYQTLKAIAGEVGDGPSLDEAILMSRDKSGSGDANEFRDPFDPEYRHAKAEETPPVNKTDNETPELPSEGVKQATGTMEDGTKYPGKMAKALETDKPGDKPDEMKAPAQKAMTKKEMAEKEEAKKETAQKEMAKKEMAEKEMAKKEMAKEDGKDEKAGAEVEKTKLAEKEGEAEDTKPDSEQLKRLKELEKQLAAAAEESETAKFANLSVEATDGGLLVSLTETAGFEMFVTSSAKPTAALIKLMDRISPILKKQTGPIVVRGHTDARPFKSGNYDNWRLSTARAHMARHMLIRGGLEKDRIVRIEGHADRHLKNKNQPTAAENRRIEVLIVDDKA